MTDKGADDQAFEDLEEALKDLDEEEEGIDQSARLLKLEKELKWVSGVLPDGKKQKPRGIDWKRSFKEAELNSSRFQIYYEGNPSNLNRNQFAKKDEVKVTIFQCNRLAIDYLAYCFKGARFLLLQRTRKILPWLVPFIQTWIIKLLGEEKAQEFYKCTQASGILQEEARQHPHLKYQAIFEVEGKCYKDFLLGLNPDCPDQATLCYEKSLNLAISKRQEVDDNLEGLKQLIKLGNGLQYSDFWVKLKDRQSPTPFAALVIHRTVNFDFILKNQKQRPKQQAEKYKRKRLENYLKITDDQVEKNAQTLEEMKSELAKLKKENKKLKTDRAAERTRERVRERKNTNYYRYKSR